jgi:hypothetical protein
MYEGLIGTIRKAVTDPKVMELGSAVVYQEGNGFSYAPCAPGEEYVSNGNDFIKLIIANDESYSWLPLSEEARSNQTYLSALINGEIMETI